MAWPAAPGPVMIGEWPLLCASLSPSTENKTSLPWWQSQGPCDCSLLHRERKQGASMGGLPLGHCLNRFMASQSPREAPAHLLG